MTVAADQQTGGVAPGAPQDVSNLSLREILSEGNALDGALERLDRETRSHEDLYAGFANFSPDDDPSPELAA